MPILGAAAEVLFRKRTARVAVFVLCVLAFSFLGAATARAVTAGVINASKVNLRKEPSISATVLATMPKGAAVTVSSSKNGWYSVQYNGKQGYVRADMVDLGGSGGKVYAAKDEINLRASASTSAKVLETLEIGKSLSVSDVVGDWYKVRVDGMTGYVRSDMTAASKPKASVTSVSKQEEDSSKTEEQETTEDAVARESNTDEESGVDIDSNIDSNKLEGSIEDEENAEKNGLSDDYFIPDEIEEAEDENSLILADDDDDYEIDEALLGKSSLSNVELQSLLQKLGFYSGTVDGKFGSKTLAALKSFQRGYDLEVDGQAGEQTTKALQKASMNGGNGSSAAKIKESNGVILAEWFNYMKSNFPKYESLRCVDVATGEEFQLRAFSLGNHADVEPPTKADTDKLYQINGGKWTWTPRAIWVYIDGQAYAAAINVKPHGSSTISDNGMNGQICMHFLHSRQHNTGAENRNLQAAVLRAFSNASKADAS